MDLRPPTLVLAAVAMQGEDDAPQRGRASAAVSPMTDDETVLGGGRERVEILRPPPILGSSGFTLGPIHG
jgi:hypothetical protein